MAPPTKDEDETAPGQAAADRVRERHQRALDRYDLETERALDAYEGGADDGDRITLADLKDALHETRQQPPQSLPVKGPVDLAVKAGREAMKSIEHVRPDRRWMIWMAIGAVLLAAYLGWLSPPERLPKQDVAPPTATT